MSDYDPTDMGIPAPKAEKIDDGGPAFPQANPLVSMDPKTFEVHRIEDGMSLRDWFAAMAANGYISACTGEDVSFPKPEAVAPYAYAVADAMIAARKQETKP